MGGEERDLQELFDAVDSSTQGDITLEQFELQYQRWAQRAAVDREETEAETAAERQTLRQKETEGQRATARQADTHPAGERSRIDHGERSRSDHGEPCYESSATADVAADPSDSPIVAGTKRPLALPADKRRRQVFVAQLSEAAASGSNSPSCKHLRVSVGACTVECGGPASRKERYTLDQLVAGGLSATQLHAEFISAQTIALIKGEDGHVVFHGTYGHPTPPMLLCPGGMVQMAGEQLFSALRRHGSQAGIRVSYIELHGERASDLLAGTAMERANGKVEQGSVSSRRRSTERDSGMWWPATAATHTCVDEHSLAALLRRGDSQRTTEATESTNRAKGTTIAHAAVRLSIEGKGRASLTFYQLVPSAPHDELTRLKLSSARATDLPGEERRNAVRAQCAVQHRQGWLALRRLLKRLSAADATESSRPVLPFRDSKLTLLLGPCLRPTLRSRFVVLGCCGTDLQAARKTLQLCCAWREAVYGARDYMDAKSPERKPNLEVARSISSTERTETRVQAQQVFEKLTDYRLFTGHHKHRFDKEGRGKGLAGRDSTGKGAGHSAVPYRGGNVHEIAQIMRPEFHSPTRRTRVISHGMSEEEAQEKCRTTTPVKARGPDAERNLERIEGRSPRREGSPHKGRAASVGSDSSRGAVFDHLTDPRLYTGHHKHRFDKEGRGKGLAGRDSTAKGAGHSAVPYRGGNVHEIAQIMRPEFHSPTRRTRVISNDVALTGSKRMDGYSPTQRTLSRQRGSRRVDLASVHARYRNMLEPESKPEREPETNTDTQNRSAKVPTGIALEVADDNAEMAVAAPQECSDEEAWRLRMDAVIASTKAAQLERRAGFNEADSPPPPDLETPGHSVLLDRSESKHAQAATHEVVEHAADSNIGNDPEIDAELWCRAVTTALAFRGLKLGVDASRRERQETESSQRLSEQRAAAAAEARAVQVEAHRALVVGELKEAEVARDQAFRRLSEETDTKSQQLLQHEQKMVALQRDLEEARSEIQHVASQRESSTDEYSAELSTARSRLSTSESLVQQLTAQLEQMKSEVSEQQALLKESGERLQEEQVFRDEAAIQLQLAQHERASLEEETKRLASELEQLRQDWFASWEAEQQLSSSATSASLAEKEHTHAREKCNSGDDDSSQDASSSLGGESAEDSYLRYLEVESQVPERRDEVDLSWWQPTAAEEKKRQGRREGNTAPVERLKEEWGKAQSAQQELREMQKKVDTRRARLRDQLARHGIKAAGDLGS